ncbi:MAG TPA: hypothetical protein VFQ95_08030 [Rhodanobacteraceae bacterium]|nr:hypothetical protein [Rhodanobacteraceae bacterium]
MKAAIVAACALVTAGALGVGVATVANAATPPTSSPGKGGPLATCPTGFVLTGTVCVRATARNVAIASVIGCPAGWSLVPLPVETDGIERSQCARGGMLAVERDGGGAGYTRGDGWTRWSGTVRIPAGRHIVTLAGDRHALAMIDGATLAPSRAAGVRGVRSVVLTGPEVVRAQVDWSGLLPARLTVKPWPGAHH